MEKQTVAEQESVADANQNLVEAAAEGNVAGMEAARVRGATAIGEALCSAAFRGQLACIIELSGWRWQNQSSCNMKMWNEQHSLLEQSFAKAAEGDQIEAMELLNDLGASDCWTALSHAAYAGKVSALKWLYKWMLEEWGPTPSALDEPLAKAVEGGHTACEKLLRGWIADPYAVGYS